MQTLTVTYSHEFISNKIRDELLLNDIFDYKHLERRVTEDIKKLYNFDISPTRNVNTLSGGQRSITYLITLRHILSYKNLDNIEVTLINIMESLSQKSRDILLNYFKKNNITIKGPQC